MPTTACRALSVAARPRQYDSLGHLVRETQSIGPGGPVRAVSAAYDGLGRRLALTYPGGRQIITTYDALGRPSAVRDETPRASSPIAVYSYLCVDRIEHRDMGDAVRLDVGYDDSCRVEGIRYTIIGTGDRILERAYAWDEAGNRVQSQTPTDPGRDGDLYFHDAVGRLVQSQRTAGPLTITYTLNARARRFPDEPVHGHSRPAPPL